MFKKRVIVCPECKKSIFKADDIRDEVYCAHCGLVVRGPPCAGIIYPSPKCIIVKM